ncbi:MAG: hypothetical protein HOZ81_04475 [Streptomyces sp.]|nr:hypothetical protein [Streptomyces sp.]
MRFLHLLALTIPSLATGISVERVAASLDAPPPVSLMAGVGMAALAIHVLDNLISTLLAYRAARRG